MMKVAYLIGAFPKFSETFIIRQIESILLEGNSVVIIACHHIDTTKVGEYSPYILKKYECNKVIFLSLDNNKFDILKRVLLNFKSFIHLISRGISLKNAVRALNIREINFSDIDIIHVQFFSLAPITYLLNKRLIKLVSIRGKDISSKESTKQKEIEFIAKNFNAFLPVSKSLAKKAKQKGIPEHRITVCYSSLDIKQLPFSLKKEGSNSPIKFLQIGRMVEKKGFELSLMLIQALKKQNINVQLELIGDGPDHYKLKQLSQKLNIESNISFLNILPNSKVINKLKHADFLLVPSLTAKDGDSEGIPNVAKEAMALGCIVIISNHSGNTELVGNKQGFVFEENNLNDYIRATLNAINSDTNKLNNIRINARQKVEKHFDHGTVIPRLLQIYKKTKS